MKINSGSNYIPIKYLNIINKMTGRQCTQTYNAINNAIFKGTLELPEDPGSVTFRTLIMLPQMGRKSTDEFLHLAREHKQDQDFDKAVDQAWERNWDR